MPRHFFAAAVMLAMSSRHACADCDYKTSREEALRSMRNYYSGPLTADVRTKPVAYYQHTFERAFRGDFAALRTVFRSPDCHSGDNEAWCDAPWDILHIVGDARFAAFLGSLSASERRSVVDAFGFELGWFGRCGGAHFDLYFRQQFPSVYVYFHPPRTKRT